MSLFVKIAYVFFKIGILTVGGGLAMIPVIQHEMVSRGWLDNQQFLDILGIAQMTPGPMSVNTATFVGYRLIGVAHPGALWLAVAGAVVGTLAVCAPSLLCVNLFGAFWSRNRNHPCMTRVFDILRPLVTGLVAVAAILLMAHAVWGEEMVWRTLASPDVQAAAIALTAFALTAFSKVSPMLILLGGACAGMVLQLVG